MGVVPKWAYALFMKIAEPRHVRIIMLWIYICMVGVGGRLLIVSPSALQSEVGLLLTNVFSGFILLGSGLGAFSVLPGIWWLERVGLILIWTGLVMFLVMVLSIGTGFAGVFLSLVLILGFILRWYGIKDWQLAPKKG